MARNANHSFVNLNRFIHANALTEPHPWELIRHLRKEGLVGSRAVVSPSRKGQARRFGKSAMAYKSHSRSEEREERLHPACTNADLRVLDDAWEAIIAALAASGFQWLDISTSGGREAIFALARRVKHTKAQCSWRGLEQTLKEMKEELGKLRLQTLKGATAKQRQLRWLSGSLRSVTDSRVKALQLSYAGRAFPNGSARVMEEALKQHKLNYSELRTSPPEFLAFAEKFACSWINRHASRPVVNQGRMSSSAALGSTRRQGGHFAILSEMAASVEQGIQQQGGAFYKEVNDLRKRLPEVPECDVDSALREYRLLVQCLLTTGLLSEGTVPLPRGVVVAVPERGFKTRVVSKGSTPWIYIGHWIRAWLFRAIRRDPRVADALLGDHSRRVLSFRGFRGKACRLLSADLTTATDRLPLDLIKAVINGIFSSDIAEDFPPWVKKAVLSLTGSQLLTYPDGSSIETMSGLLMGLPISWPILNIIHLSWVTWAWSDYRKSNSGLACSRQTPNTAICGDDLIGLWPDGVIKRYEDIVVRCGGKFSEGKHFDASVGGVFTEEMYFLEALQTSRKVRIPYRRPCRPMLGDFFRATRPRTDSHEAEPRVYYRIRKVPGMLPLRGLVRGRSGQAEIPQWVSLGIVVEGLRDEQSLRAARRVIRCLQPGLSTWLKTRGIYPTLPRFLGGGGLPPNRGNPSRLGRLPKPIRQQVAALLYGTKPSRVTNPSRFWTVGRTAASYQMAEEAALERLSHGIVTRTGRRPLNGRGIQLLGTVTTATDKCLAYFLREMRLMLGERPVPQFRISPFSVGNSVRRFYRRLTKLWRSFRGVNVRALRTRLRGRLDSFSDLRQIWFRLGHDALSAGLDLSTPAKCSLSRALGWAPNP
jgi:hypothetical protein